MRGGMKRNGFLSLLHEPKQGGFVCFYKINHSSQRVIHEQTLIPNRYYFSDDDDGSNQ